MSAADSERANLPGRLDRVQTAAGTTEDELQVADDAHQAARDDSRGGVSELFRRFSHRTSVMVGSPWAFVLAASVILVWAVSGPLFAFSNTWQLVINTGTTVVTFLMVFLIQNTQNRDARAMHLKLDELIRAIAEASDGIIDAEEASDRFLDEKTEEYRVLSGR